MISSHSLDLSTLLKLNFVKIAPSDPFLEMYLIPMYIHIYKYTIEAQEMM